MDGLSCRNSASRRRWKSGAGHAAPAVVSAAGERRPHGKLYRWPTPIGNQSSNSWPDTVRRCFREPGSTAGPNRLTVRPSPSPTAGSGASGPAPNPPSTPSSFSAGGTLAPADPLAGPAIPVRSVLPECGRETRFESAPTSNLAADGSGMDTAHAPADLAG